MSERGSPTAARCDREWPKKNTHGPAGNCALPRHKCELAEWR